LDSFRTIRGQSNPGLVDWLIDNLWTGHLQTSQIAEMFDGNFGVSNYSKCDLY